MTTILHYEQHVGRLVDQYESLAFEEVHASLLDLLPAPGATILDIGAGSGRDAAWFAARGDDVVAVEPSDAMRTHARALHPSPRIHWLADSLPELAQLRRLGLTFDFILLSAVWMHVPPASRARALRKLATLLAPNGRIAISLRLGEPDATRAMRVVSLPELMALSQQFGLRLLQSNDSADRLGRAGVSWSTAVLGLPDDGLGALPLLRHLVLVDEKSSTYKIALLRILARIADTANGSARHEADYVAIPLGMVALLTVFLAIIFSKAAYAAPSSTVINSCLTTEAVSSSIHYVKLKPTNYYQEEDDDITSMTFKFEGLATGTWESSSTKKFGLVYKDQKVRQQNFVRLGLDEPTRFDPTLAQWGVVTTANQTYLCTAFNFDGLGQSGSFQNIRGVYIIEVKKRPAKIYYIVSDARRVSR